MEVLKFLSSNKIEELQKYHVKIKEYPEHNLAVLNYDQINSPKFHPIVQECRGLIIDTKNIKLVSRSFNRFFNLNERQDDPFDFNNKFIAEEKADGSLITVYYFNGLWRIATRGNAFAEGKTTSGITFYDLFESVIGCNINEFMKNEPTYYSYVFELCSIHNKVVKLYKEPVIYLLSIYDLRERKEIDREYINMTANRLGVKRPFIYNINSINDIHISFKDFDPTEEGYVLIDKNKNRIKVKNPAYVDLHHLKGNGEITPKRIANVIFRGETEEVLSYFPEYEEFFMPYQQAYDKLMNSLYTKWEELKNESLTQKEFALKIKDYPAKSILFSLRNGLTIDEIMNNLSSNAKINLLENFKRS